MTLVWPRGSIGGDSKALLVLRKSREKLIRFVRFLVLVARTSRPPRISRISTPAGSGSFGSTLSGSLSPTEERKATGLIRSISIGASGRRVSERLTRKRTHPPRIMQIPIPRRIWPGTLMRLGRGFLEFIGLLSSVSERFPSMTEILLIGNPMPNREINRTTK